MCGVPKKGRGDGGAFNRCNTKKGGRLAVARWGRFGVGSVPTEPGPKGAGTGRGRL